MNFKLQSLTPLISKINHIAGTCCCQDTAVQSLNDIWLWCKVSDIKRRLSELYIYVYILVHLHLEYKTKNVFDILSTLTVF